MKRLAFLLIGILVYGSSGTSLRAQRSNPLTSTVDCFVADAPRNDAPEMTPRRAVTVTPEVRQAWYAMWDGTNRADYDWDAYPTYEAYENMMHQFAEEHPDRCTYMELGTLASGRKLMFCRINNGEPDGKPKFLYTSTMHGNELTGMMLMLRFLDELCTSDDQRIVNLINNLDIFISPNTNPDDTYYGGNHTVADARRRNANDVDLNRNYPDFDNGPHPDGFEYQDETLWMMDLAEVFPFTMAANFHTGSELLNYPWDTYQPLHPDDDWWQMVCHEYADLTHRYDPLYMSNYDNGIVNGYVWFPIWGSRQDYMNYYAQCREVTIECSSAYMPDPSLMPMYWTYNHESIISYMEQCLNGIHGTVTDSITGRPLEAMVFIADHDHDGSSVSSHLPAGDYHRLIKGGTYDVTYTSCGYFSQTHTIKVVDGEAVVKDVRLVPTTVGLEEVPDQKDGEYHIINMIGQTVRTGRIPVDVSTLPNGLYILKTGNTASKIVVRH